MLSQVVFCAEAKQKNVKEGVDVYSTHSNTYNGPNSVPNPSRPTLRDMY